MKGAGSRPPKDQWYRCGLRIVLIAETRLIECFHHRDFADSESLVTCTLLGSLSQYEVGVESTETAMVWSKDTKGLEKVNCMRSNGSYIVVGGFSNDGRGCFEVYGAQHEE